MTELDIYRAIEARLQGLTVTRDQTTYAVPVMPGMVSPDFQRRDYPKISFNMLSHAPDYVRQSTDSDLFNRSIGIPYVASRKKQPQALTMMLQVDCWARNEIHLHAMTRHVMKALDRERTYLELKGTTSTAMLAEGGTLLSVASSAGYAVGDYAVLDARIVDQARDARQAFIVAAIPDSTTLELSEPANRDFSFGSSVYEARLDVMHTNTAFDSGDDAGRPYVRRIQTYDIWGCVDFDAIDSVPYVADPADVPGSGVILDIHLDYSRVVEGGHLGYQPYR